MKQNNLVLTPEGYIELEEQLNELKTVRRPEIIQAIKDARAQGDLSENADYDAARAEQGQVEALIKEIEYRLEHSEIIDKTEKGVVSLGSTVTVTDEDGDEDTYKIVGSVEADLFNNKVSNESPIGQALIGHKVKDVVTVKAPNGDYTLTIVKVA